MQLVSTQLNRFGLATALLAILASAMIARLNVMGAVAVSILALAVLLPVEVALGAFAFLAPFDYVLAIGHHDSAVHLTWLAGAFAGGVLLVYGFISGRLRRPPRQAWYWGAFMIWHILSTAWSINTPLSIARLPSVLSILGLYVVVVSFRTTSRELSRVLLLAVVGGVVASIISIHQAALVGFQARGALKFGEFEGNPNEFAFSLLLPFSVAFAGVLSRGSALKKFLLLAALIIVTGGIFLAMSRGALAALVVTTVTLLLKVGVRKRVLIPLIAVALPLLFVPSLFYQRLKEAPTREDTGRSRLDIAFVGLQVIKHNPILGTGLETFPIAYDRYSGYSPQFRGYHFDPHNTYLQAWAETGIVGFVLLLIALGSQIKAASAALRAPPRDYVGVAIEAVCFGALIFGFSGSLEWNKSFWLMLMLLTLLTQLRSGHQRLTSFVGSPQYSQAIASR